MAMAEELSFLEPFTIDLQWPADPGRGGHAILDASLVRFQMKVGEKALTTYQTEKGDTGSFLTIPTYYLIEWLALNWWSFLYEPRKIDDQNAERDFRSRHWFGFARNGFALPDVLFSPAGDKVEIIAKSAFLRFAGLGFTESLDTFVETTTVKREFSSFIDNVLNVLTKKGIIGTDAHIAWKRVVETTAEEEPYCRLVGAMGLSPYCEHPEIDAILAVMADKFPVSMLIDLCDATFRGNFRSSADLTTEISEDLNKAEPVDMHEFLKTSRPDDLNPKAYEWGYRATDAARSAFDISHDDPLGSIALFERLKLSFLLQKRAESEVAGASPVTGAVARSEDIVRMSLANTTVPHRKFAAARALFLTWSRANASSRLVTSARTRDQQASRAFAAELLAPSRYLARRLGDRREVSPFTLDKISDEIGISPAVVYYQANNHGYYVSEAA